MAVDQGRLSAEPVAAASEAPDRQEATTADGGLILTIFGVLWALSVLLHIYASPALVGMLHGGGGLPGLASLVVAVAALALLAQPMRTAPLVLVCAATVVSAVADAPTIGNHWVLQAMVSLGLLGAAAHTALAGQRAGTGFSRARLAALSLPLLRWSVLCFYVFAAFSKLNHAFLNPAVSCANVFADGSLRSFGLPGHLTGGSGFWPRVIPYLALTAELSVPVLVLGRRTRPYGIALVLVFHSLVSADRHHPIGDFGSYLVASYLLFLPAAFFGDVGRWMRARTEIVERAAAALLLVAATLVVLEANGRGDLAGRALEQGRWLLWIALDLTVVAVVLGWLARHRFRFAPEAEPATLGWPRQALWLLVIPGLIVFNGLTPYLELKTSYGWNMYSNLRTVAGESNHLIVPGTLELSSVQTDMVQILTSDDPGLQDYADRDFSLPLLQLRAYLAEHPGASLSFRLHGQLTTVAHARDLPELVKPVGYWQQRLSAFRASTSPGAGPEVCQPTWLAAN